MIPVSVLRQALYWLWDQVFHRLVDWVVYAFQLLRGWGDTAIHSLLGWAAVAFPAVDWASIKGYTDQVNFFFPLSETIALAVTYLGLWIGVWLYRTIKSWIPTVSGA